MREQYFQFRANVLAAASHTAPRYNIKGSIHNQCISRPCYDDHKRVGTKIEFLIRVESTSEVTIKSAKTHITDIHGNVFERPVYDLKNLCLFGNGPEWRHHTTFIDDFPPEYFASMKVELFDAEGSVAMLEKDPDV